MPKPSPTHTIKTVAGLWIIDDDPYSALLASVALGQEVQIRNLILLEEAPQALQKLRELTASGEKFPEIILLDINMPVMSGFEFLEEVAQEKLDFSHTKVFLYTSSIDIRDTEQIPYSPLPIAGYLIKPLDKPQIDLICQALILKDCTISV